MSESQRIRGKSGLNVNHQNFIQTKSSTIIKLLNYADFWKSKLDRKLAVNLERRRGGHQNNEMRTLVKFLIFTFELKLKLYHLNYNRDISSVLDAYN